MDIKLSNIEYRNPLEASKRLRIAITDSCNLCCFFCHGDGGKVKHFQNCDSNLSPYDISSIIQIAKKNQIKKIKLTGGEPLQYKYNSYRFPDLLNIINDNTDLNSLELSLVTNGTLLNDKNIESLINNNIKNVTISLHSSSPETFKRYTNVGNNNVFYSVINGIEKASKAGFDTVKINSVLYYSRENESLRNIDDIANLIKIASKNNISELRFFVIIDNKFLPKDLFNDTVVYWNDKQFSEMPCKEIVDTIRNVMNGTSLNVFTKPGTFRAKFDFTEGSRGSKTVRIGFQNFDPYQIYTSNIPFDKNQNRQEGTYALRVTNSGHLIRSLNDEYSQNIVQLIREGKEDHVNEIITQAQEYFINANENFATITESFEKTLNLRNN